jgi:hypothetical protein
MKVSSIRDSAFYTPLTHRSRGGLPHGAAPPLAVEMSSCGILLGVAPSGLADCCKRYPALTDFVAPRVRAKALTYM